MTKTIYYTDWTLIEGKPSTGLEYCVEYDADNDIVVKINSVCALERNENVTIDVTFNMINKHNLDDTIEDVTKWSERHAEQFPKKKSVAA